MIFYGVPRFTIYFNESDMDGHTIKMEKDKSQVSVLELKRLLFTIVDAKMQIYFRCRFMGEMWRPRFMKITKITENGLLLFDESENKLTLIHDLSTIIQFEIDAAVHAFEPHYHYNLVL